MMSSVEGGATSNEAGRLRHPQRHPWRHPRTFGQALVEFALILPLVLTILFGIIDFGYFLFVQVSVAHTVREATRFASMNNRTRQDIRDDIRHFSPGIEIPASAITITTNASDPTFFGSPPSVVVTVSYMHQFLTPLVFTGITEGRVWASSRSIVQTWETTPEITF